MPIDPHLTLLDQVNPDVRISSRVADLERRLKVLEHARPTVQVVSGTPGGTPRDGTLAGDTADKIWLRINGAWKSVAVT